MSNIINILFFANCFNLISEFLLQKTEFIYIYNKNIKTKITSIAKINSTLFSLIIIPNVFYLIYFNNIFENKITANSLYIQYTIEFSAGYFLWDLYFSIMYKEIFGNEFIFHAIFSFIAYFQASISGYYIYFFLNALLYECSTPFLNLKWFLYLNNLRNNQIYKINNILFVFFFILVRIIFGTYLTFNIITTMTSSIIPDFIKIMNIILILSSYILNCKWASYIICKILFHLNIYK